MHQIHHKLRLKPIRSQIDVLEAVESVCDPKLLKIYEYIPPQMKKGCQDFFDAHASERHRPADFACPTRAPDARAVRTAARARARSALLSALQRCSDVIGLPALLLPAAAVPCHRPTAAPDDELEEIIVQGRSQVEVSDKVCLELTGVCNGIDWKMPTAVAGYEEYVPPEPQPEAPKKKKSKRKGKGKVGGAEPKDEV
jgi:hypothetical protein